MGNAVKLQLACGDPVGFFTSSSGLPWLFVTQTTIVDPAWLLKSDETGSSILVLHMETP